MTDCTTLDSRGERRRCRRQARRGRLRARKDAKRARRQRVKEARTDAKVSRFKLRETRRAGKGARALIGKGGRLLDDETRIASPNDFLTQAGPTGDPGAAPPLAGGADGPTGEGLPPRVLAVGAAVVVVGVFLLRRR